jgi:hypothetical protein
LAESCLSRIGPINLDVKQMGERNAANPHVAFDVAGAGNVAWSRHFDRSRRASPRPYRRGGGWRRGTVEIPARPARQSSTLPNCSGAKRDPETAAQRQELRTFIADIPSDKGYRIWLVFGGVPLLTKSPANFPWLLSTEQLTRAGVPLYGLENLHDPATTRSSVLPWNVK